ncbi:hypothetical protein TSUD_330670 [Trifolium subterraneum]|nr:hypothetical protein TSUD_330670 [Trifolium subterraneum]
MDNIDRISDLPRNVIDGILENLDIRDLVRTSILSTKWRKMWISVPRLEFDSDFLGSFQHLDDPNQEVAKVITDVLMIHDGPIYKFTLVIPFDKIAMEDFRKWFQILLGKKIKYLDLVNYSRALNHMPYIVFSCKELIDVKFYVFMLSIPPNFCGFKRLLNLHLERVAFNPGALEGLISSCPLLEKLTIEHCYGFEYFDFTTTSLKVLILGIYQVTKSICLKKAKNLIDLKLMTYVGWESGLIKSLPKIQKLSIDLRRFKFNIKILPIADVIPPMLLKSSFGSIEYLKLDGVSLMECGELLYIVSVLKSAPSLVELVIIQAYDRVDITQAPNHLEELECSSCCLNRLQTVNIFVNSCSQHVMSLIKFILVNSTSLKTLTFRVGVGGKKLSARMLLRISQDLLLMKRASQRAQVKFLPF